ncbi:amidohydrolase family protein [Dongia sp.]|uniref:N-acyl-D-amino-acid deacylase family protein n=1 Tax=Dongia sp. TaxID=1977262 RepID=UPI0035AF2702
MTHDILICGGEIIDGSGAKRFAADVAIDGDRITAIGKLTGHTAKQTIDASGCIVAPGFIDAHAHDDIALLAEPDMPSKVSQGCTTVVVGNCGFSAAPLTPRDSYPLDFLLGDTSYYRFPRVADYFAELEVKPASVNAAALVGHSALRVECMAALDRPATEAEIALMGERLRQALAEGALGFSTGLEYPSNKAADTREVVALARLAGEAGAVYTTHSRNYDHHFREALQEAIDIGQAANVPLILSHHQGDGPENKGHTDWSLPMIDAARKSQPVALDVYPYNAAATIIDPAFVLSAERILISSSQPHPEMAGRELDDIAAEWGVDRDTAADRLTPGGAIYFCQDEADVQKIMAFGPTMIGSDGLPGGEINHPRLWGSFPRVLGHYSRDLGLFDLETAIHKMTGLTARRFGLIDRGKLAEGAFADVTVFDPATVIDRATFTAPTEPSLGIRFVLVNGALVWRDGHATGARPGRPLRRSATVPPQSLSAPRAALISDF